MATAAPKLKPVPDQSTQEVAPTKSKSKLIVMIVVACSLIIGGGGAAWYFTGQKPATSGPKAAEVQPPTFLVLEPFTVNLRGDSEEQFLQVAMTLQLKDQADADQIKLYMPEVRDRLLILLSNKAGSEILTPEGKKKLADEIIASLKKPFAPHTKQQSVNNVFFTSFVVQ
jgi:flagellar protein FliL